MKIKLPHKPKIKTALFCLILLIPCILIAQDNSNQLGDSLQSVWKNLKKPDSARFKAINAYYVNQTFAQPDSVLLLADYHIKLAKEKGAGYQIALAFNEKSYAYYVKGDTKTSKKMLEESIKILEGLDSPKKLATVYSNLGNIYGEEDKYQEAVRYFTKSLKIFQDENIARGEARMLNNLGIIYSLLDNHKLTLDYLDRALQKYKELGLEKSNGGALTVIGNVYYDQGNYTEALVQGEKAISLLLEQNNKFGATNCYYLLARTQYALGNSKKALWYIEKGIELAYTIDNNSRIIQNLTFKAELILEKNINEATSQANHVLTLLSDDTENDLKASLYLLLYKCYKAQKKYNKSLQMHEIHLNYKDSVQLEKNNMVIIEEAIKNEFEEKLLSEKLANKNTQSELRIQQLKKTYFLVAAFIGILAGILLYTRSRMLAYRKKRTHLLEELERLKKVEHTAITTSSNAFQLDREKIEARLKRKINETDWIILNILLEDPVIANKEIAKKAFLSVDGIGSSLRRMYDYFEIKESKYKKISLLLEATKISNKLN